VIAADGIYSAASPSSTVSDLTRQIKDGPGNVVVCSEEMKDLALSAAYNAGISARNVLVLKSYPLIQLKSADGAVECDFKGSLDWRRITDPKELEYSKACILYSSGTTGLPKGGSLSACLQYRKRRFTKTLICNRCPHISSEYGFRVLSSQYSGP
jgi:long-subunit acyl-CoA synthetase (AMP-forming)